MECEVSFRLRTPIRSAVAPHYVEIKSCIDGFEFPATLTGWAYWTLGQEREPGIIIEALRGNEVIARAEPDKLRPDIASDSAIKVGFSIDCAGLCGMQDLLSGRVRIRAITPRGLEASVPIWHSTRGAVAQELQLRPWRAEAMDLTPEILRALALYPKPSAQAGRPRRLAKLGFAGYRSAMRRPKIVFICSSASDFGHLLEAILGRPALNQSRITIFDDDIGRLRASHVAAQLTATRLGNSHPVCATGDYDQAFAGADYVLTFGLPGLPNSSRLVDAVARSLTRIKLGTSMSDIQTILNAQRVIPALLALASRLDEICPNALHLNYVEPLSATTWALARHSKMPVIGMSTGVSEKAEDIAHDLSVPLNRLRYLAGGIDKMSYFLRLEEDGFDLYPRLHALMADPRLAPAIRHNYEGLDWLRYAASAPHLPRSRERRPGTASEDRYSQSVPHGAALMAATETGSLCVIYGLFANKALIPNLPEHCAVEVPCLVDSNGLQPVPVGPLPPQLAAMMYPHIGVQGLTVESALSGKKDHLYQAMMLTPRSDLRRNPIELNRAVDRIWQAGRQIALPPGNPTSPA
jgi:alpha-galactosidase